MEKSATSFEYLTDEERAWLAYSKEAGLGVPAVALQRLNAERAKVARIAELATLPEVTEESTDCPECGASVNWRGDYAPDIGDQVACDECVSGRLYAIAAALKGDGG